MKENKQTRCFTALTEEKAYCLELKSYSVANNELILFVTEYNSLFSRLIKCPEIDFIIFIYRYVPQLVGLYLPSVDIGEAKLREEKERT